MSNAWVRVAFRIGITVSVLPAAAGAAGLGGIQVQSALGQPLRATVALTAADTGSYNARCARARLESIDGNTVIPARVERIDGGSGPALEIRTAQHVNELALNVVASLECGAPIERRYAILLDPPTPTADGHEPPAVAVAAGESKPAPPAAGERKAGKREQRAVVAQAEPARGSSRRLPPAQPARRSQASAGAPAASRSKPAASQPGLAAPEPKTDATRSVLRLSAPDQFYARPRLQLKMDDTLTLPSPASHAERMAELRAEQRRLALAQDGDEIAQRAQMLVDGLRSELNVLQSELRVLRKESERMQQQRQAEQTALETERNRSLNWIISLGALITLCLGAIAWLLWRVVHMQKAGAQIPWNEFDTQHGIEPDASGFNTTAFHPTLFGPTLHAEAEAPQAEGGETRKAAGPDTQVGVPAQSAEDRAEEITDVMELAEAWLALNNPDKVLELLKPFSEVERPQSPLPWLCLLDVYRALGDREKYEAILRRIRNLYNVRLANWDERTAQAATRTLADYPHVIERIVALWNDDGIRDYLNGLLHDIRDGGRDGFDLPVYRDILRLLALLDDPTCDRSKPELDPRVYAILFAVREPAEFAQRPGGDEGATPEQAAAPSEEKRPVPRLPERPRYITPSYERAVLARRPSLAAEQDEAGEQPTTVVVAGPEPLPAPEPTREFLALVPAAEESCNAQAEAARPALAEEEDELTPVAIKLHLAVAYQDIGDTEGAALLLEEVIEHGTREQSERARIMLSRLA